MMQRRGQTTTFDPRHRAFLAAGIETKREKDHDGGGGGVPKLTNQPHEHHPIKEHPTSHLHDIRHRRFNLVKPFIRVRGFCWGSRA